MSLPQAASSFHTAWVTAPGMTPHPVRYAVDGDHLVCFSDRALADVRDHARVTVAIHQIAGGHLVAQFGASLRRSPADSVSESALLELLEHVPLGRTLEEVRDRLQHHRAGRTVVELVP